MFTQEEFDIIDKITDSIEYRPPNHEIEQRTSRVIVRLPNKIGNVNGNEVNETKVIKIVNLALLIGVIGGITEGSNPPTTVTTIPNKAAVFIKS